MGAKDYDFKHLKSFKGKSVIYGLYVAEGEIKYVGHSTNVYDRFRNHLINSEHESNTKKKNWIDKHKGSVRIEILSIDHENWEQEEIIQIKKYSNNDLLNICIGGKNNRIKKPFSMMTKEEHLLDINKALKFMNNMFLSKGKEKRFELFTKDEIKTLSE